MYSLPNKQSTYMINNWITPQVTVHKGDDSTADKVAPWLPLLRRNEPKEIDVVISSGTPVAFCGPYLVPAGYRLEIQAIKNGEEPTIKYTQKDVDAFVTNFKGEQVKEGESVLQSVIDAGMDVSVYVGVTTYDAFQNQGNSPSELRYMNFDPQPTVAYNMDYHYELPLVASDEDYAKAPYKGISAFIGLDVFPGQFVTYNKASKFVVADGKFELGNTKPEYVLGQVTAVYLNKDPKTGTVVNPVNGLDRVINMENWSGNVLNELPGTRNHGMTQKIQYANAYGTVLFGLQNR